NSNWRARYAKWPGALEKLLYVDSLVKEALAQAKESKPGRVYFSASRMKVTLEKFYARRKKENAEEQPDFFDEDLRRLFKGPSTKSKRENSAKSFLKRNRKD